MVSDALINGNGSDALINDENVVFFQLASCLTITHITAAVHAPSPCTTHNRIHIGSE